MFTESTCDGCGVFLWYTEYREVDITLHKSRPDTLLQSNIFTRSQLCNKCNENLIIILLHT